MRKLKFLLPSIFMMSTLLCEAQPGSYIGNWVGTLDVGISLRVVFHLSDNGKGGLVGTLDSPDQSAFGLKCDTIFLSQGSINIEMHNLKASFTGKLTNDSTIDGNFTQVKELPLTLKKTNEVIALKRPQTPKPPFPYKSQDVTYTNADNSIRFGATITVPEGNGPFPAAVMITGSGAQNRDEEIFGHKSFAVIADFLTRKGYIVLRVDDRGVGQTTGDFGAATSADFAKDVSAGVDYLLTRPEVDKKKLGLIGHSEGGMIAPMVATQRKDIDFIILLAGPGVKIIELMALQNRKILESSGINQEAVNAYMPFFEKTHMGIVAAITKDSAINVAYRSLNEWLDTTPQKLVIDLGMEKDKMAVAKEMVNTTYTPWFKYFMTFDPQPYLQKLNCKVLALNGDKDVQVVSSQNLPGIESSLKKSKTKNYTIKELPGLNHLFQKCIECTLQEYGQLEETFSPDALKIMGDWLDKNVK